MKKLMIAACVAASLTACSTEPPVINPSDLITKQANVQEDTAVAVWANEAIVAVNSYSFSSIPEYLVRTQAYFTPVGWQSFKAALEQSNNLEWVREQKFVVSAVAEGPPMILSHSLSNPNQRGWVVQMPTLVVYIGGAQQIKQHQIITLQIVHLGGKQGVRGYAITQWVGQVKPAPKPAPAPKLKTKPITKSKPKPKQP